MFSKLRLQLTLINLTIIALLFLFLTTGIYFVFQNNMKKHSNFMSHKLAAEINSGAVLHYPKFKEDTATFFLKTDRSGKITFQSDYQPLKPPQLTGLIKKTLHLSKTEDIVFVEGKEYSYLKTPLPNKPGFLLIFHNLEGEKRLLRDLLTALLVTGFVGLILSLFGSFFLASRAIAPIQRAWQQQKKFLADASHELRTPLAVIQTNLEVVLSSQEETVASQARWLINIKEESDSMTKLVSSLLFLARVDSQQQTIEKTVFLIDEVIRRSAEPFQPVALFQGVDLQIAVEPAVSFCGDAGKIKQLVAILLDNALKATSPEGKISLALKKNSKEIILTVADTGCGIEGEHLGKIFDRFYQTDKSRSGSGEGLGLSIAKWIVDSHGGLIKVNSEPHVKTEFSIYFPLNKC